MECCNTYRLALIVESSELDRQIQEWWSLESGCWRSRRGSSLEYARRRGEGLRVGRPAGGQESIFFNLEWENINFPHFHSPWDWSSNFPIWRKPEILILAGCLQRYEEVSRYQSDSFTSMREVDIGSQWGPMRHAVLFFFFAVSCSSSSHWQSRSRASSGRKSIRFQFLALP